MNFRQIIAQSLRYLDHGSKLFIQQRTVFSPFNLLLVLSRWVHLPQAFDWELETTLSNGEALDEDKVTRKGNRSLDQPKIRKFS